MKTLSERIKSLRLQKKLTQQQLGDIVGTSKSSVSQWESGLTKKMDGEHLTRTAKALGVNALWLSTGEGDMRPSPLKTLPAPESNTETLSAKKQQTVEHLKQLLAKDIDPMDEVLLQQIIENVSRKYRDD